MTRTTLIDVAHYQLTNLSVVGFQVILNSNIGHCKVLCWFVDLCSTNKTLLVDIGSKKLDVLFIYIHMYILTY